MTGQSQDQRTEVGAPVVVEGEGFSTTGVVVSREINLDDRTDVRIDIGESPRTAADLFARTLQREEHRVTRTTPAAVKFDATNSGAGFQHPTDPKKMNGARVDRLPSSRIIPGSTPGDRLSGKLPGSKIKLGDIRLRHLKQEVLDLIRGTGGVSILRPVRYASLSDELKAIAAKGERMPAAEDVISADVEAETLVPAMSAASGHTHSRSPLGVVSNDENTSADGSIKRTIAGESILPTGEWIDSGKWHVGFSMFVPDTWGGPQFNVLNAGWTFGNGESTYEEDGSEPWSAAQGFADFGGATCLSFIFPKSSINVGPQSFTTGETRKENPSGLLLAIDYTIKEIVPWPRTTAGGGIAWASFGLPDSDRWLGQRIPSQIASNESYSPWHDKPGKYTALIRLRQPYRIFAHPTDPWPEPIFDEEAEAKWTSERRSYFRFAIGAMILATKITITDPRVRFVGLAADPEYRRWARTENSPADWSRSICVP